MTWGGSSGFGAVSALNFGPNGGSSRNNSALPQTIAIVLTTLSLSPLLREKEVLR